MPLIKRAFAVIPSSKLMLVALSAFLLISVFVVDNLLVPTGSMNPTIVEGDFIATNKLAYGFRVPFTHKWLYKGKTPLRGDIVVFSSPENGKTLVKRVIGVPGDRVEMHGERLFINGQRLRYEARPVAQEDDLLQATRRLHPVFYREALPGGKLHDMQVIPQQIAYRNFGPVSVPPDQYLVLGDNRDNSVDSRFIGFVPRDNLIGKTFAVAVSVNPDKLWSPRWHRFVKVIE